MNGGLDDLAQLTPDLASLGWDDELDAWAEAAELELRTEDDAAAGDGGAGSGDGDGGDEGAHGLIRGRLAQVTRGYSVIFTGGDALLAASGSARFVSDDVPATGDFVLVSHDPEDGPVIAAIAPRRTALRRRASGRVPEPQVLAANADEVFVMHGLDRELNLRRLERQLVVAWDSGATPVVVLTKADTVDDPAAVIERARAVAPEVEVLAVSTISGDDLDAVAGHVPPGRSVALLGPSGIGKSSLVNALSAGRVQRIGEVRAADRRGRHTTVTRDLIPLPDRGLVIDAPGVREIGLWQAYDGLEKAFPEITAASATCRFTDCDHQAEPDCGVRAGLADGAIAPRRLEHWRELSAELALQEDQLEEFARRAESRDRAAAEDERDATRSSRRSRTRRSRGKGRRRGR